MTKTAQEPGDAGVTVVDETEPTVEEVLLCVHDCVHTLKADSYRRAYWRFVNAVAEAQSDLPLEVINQVLKAADAFEDNDVCECDGGEENGGTPILEQITPELAAAA